MEKKMKLGFVSAIVPDLSLEEVVGLAAEENYSCVELMCWPAGKASRRYAGVTHLDVVNFKKSDAARVTDVMAAADVEISGLGYYPNPLTPNPEEAKVYIGHIRKVINAARLLGVDVVNTFIGRDWTKSVDDNWPRFRKVWRPLVKYAEDRGVRIGIENCPMFFSNDEWPSGKNMAHSPAIWRRMFEDIDSPNFGLNYDPSHLVWQQIDIVKPLYEFADRIFHVHAKDARVDIDRLNDVGVLATPSQYHTPKLPGLGDVNWSAFRDTGETQAIVATEQAISASVHTGKKQHLT
jgi:sugar phosphate isomerase/epimerase